MGLVIIGVLYQGAIPVDITDAEGDRIGLIIAYNTQTGQGQPNFAGRSTGLAVGGGDADGLAVNDQLTDSGRGISLEGQIQIILGPDCADSQLFTHVNVQLVGSFEDFAVQSQSIIGKCGMQVAVFQHLHTGNSSFQSLRIGNLGLCQSAQALVGSLSSLDGFLAFLGHGADSINQGHNFGNIIGHLAVQLGIAVANGNAVDSDFHAVCCRCLAGNTGIELQHIALGSGEAAALKTGIVCFYNQKAIDIVLSGNDLTASTVGILNADILLTVHLRNIHNGILAFVGSIHVPVDQLQLAVYLAEAKEEALGTHRDLAVGTGFSLNILIVTDRHTHAAGEESTVDDVGNGAVIRHVGGIKADLQNRRSARHIGQLFAVDSYGAPIVVCTVYIRVKGVQNEGQPVRRTSSTPAQYTVRNRTEVHIVQNQLAGPSVVADLNENGIGIIKVGDAQIRQGDLDLTGSGTGYAGGVHINIVDGQLIHCGCCSICKVQVQIFGIPGSAKLSFAQRQAAAEDLLISFAVHNHGGGCKGGMEEAAFQLLQLGNSTLQNIRILNQLLSKCTQTVETGQSRLNVTGSVHSHFADGIDELLYLLHIHGHFLVQVGGGVTEGNISDGSQHLIGLRLLAALNTGIELSTVQRCGAKIEDLVSVADNPGSILFQDQNAVNVILGSNILVGAIGVLHADMILVALGHSYGSALVGLGSGIKVPVVQPHFAVYFTETEEEGFLTTVRGRCSGIFIITDGDRDAAVQEEAVGNIRCCAVFRQEGGLQVKLHHRISTCHSCQLVVVVHYNTSVSVAVTLILGPGIQCETGSVIQAGSSPGSIAMLCNLVIHGIQDQLAGPSFTVYLEGNGEFTPVSAHAHGIQSNGDLPGACAGLAGSQIHIVAIDLQNGYIGGSRASEGQVQVGSIPSRTDIQGAGQRQNTLVNSLVYIAVCGNLGNRIDCMQIAVLQNL